MVDDPGIPPLALRVIADAPVTVPLAERGVAGLAGPGDVPRAAGRWLVAQVAALHSPEDVQVCVLTGASGQADWAWARWLPHCRPAFVLVDYKGGSAFKDCVHLPHVTGMVTDLDAHLTQRALTSLSAELRRREEILAAAGVKDVEDYTERASRQPRHPPLPRLVIVIDEFASLARDLPDFVAGLVGIAQRGRSLGLHLILATQRPSGVVSADIRANTNLRIALRMTDVAESADVIDAPDAARIAKSTPGRAYVRLGHGSLVPFQAGRIGGRRPGAAAPARPWVRPADWAGLGRPEPRRPQDPAARQAAGVAGDPDTLASGFGGWQADARRARRGCLTAPQTLPEGDLIGARLSHAHLGHPVRPGRALLNPGNGTLITVTVPTGLPSSLSGTRRVRQRRLPIV